MFCSIMLAFYYMIKVMIIADNLTTSIINWFVAQILVQNRKEFK